MTPNQLFIHGALQQNMVPVMPNAPSNGAVATQPTERDHVRIPLLQFTPCTNLQQQLDGINPLGFDYFDCNANFQATDVVGRHLTRGCSNCTV